MKALVEWARMVVLDGDLRAKLTPPPSILPHQEHTEFEVPHALMSLPQRPVRDGVFPLDKNTPKTHPEAMLSAEDRARLLHSFANHELLALEIMALMLLKFPEMPASFQGALVHTIKDEQKHFSLYRKRLKQLGYDFGSFGINYYLWDICARSASPLEFLVQMAMTFEQANLDFALFYEKKFRDAGDEKSAEIMAVVYRDEISHVHSGLKWFERWRPKEESLWKTYLKLLPAPLTPARAKGFGFNEEIRRKIGFDQDYIRELRFFSHSKGRPPNIWWFNPEVESELENGTHSYQPSSVFTKLQHDFALHLAYLAKKDDVVCVPEKPSECFLKTLEQLGFSQPEFVSIPEIPTQLGGRKFGKFMPWGISKRSIATAHTWSLDLRIPEYSESIHTLVSRKSWAKKILKLYLSQESRSYPDFESTDFGDTFQSEDQFSDLVQKLAKNCENIVVKSDYSCSGRGHKKFSSALTFADYSPQEKGWIRKHLREEGALTIEPWLGKVADFSIQIQVGDLDQSPSQEKKSLEDPIRTIGITRFLTDHLGHYKGHVLGDLFDGLPQSFKRWYHESQKHLELQKIGEFVGRHLRSAGYRGPAGIDILFYQKGQDFALYPLVEINPRFTMGRVALALSPRISKKSRCRWVHLRLEQITKELGHIPSLTPDQKISVSLHLLEILNENICLPKTDSPALLEQGAYATSDITRPHQSLSLLILGSALERFERLGFG